MRQTILCSVFLLFVTLAAYCGDEEWHSVKVLKHDALTIYIKVKKRATMADEDWLCIEFENTRETPFDVRNANWRIESERYNVKSKKLVSSGGLASGSDFDLFPHAWDTTPVANRLVKKGKYRVSQQVSDRAAYCLGLPPADGLLVKARFYISIEFADGQRVKTPGREGVPFEFEWRYPDKAGFEAMKKRLKHILKNPIRWQHSWILYPLLDTPEVVNSVTIDDLLDGIKRRKNSVDRQCLMKYINKHYCDDKKVIDFFLKRLKEGDTIIARSLAGEGKDIWHKNFIEPLVTIYEKHRNVWELWLLYRHRAEWEKSQNIPQRLSGALLKNYDFLKKKPEELDKERTRTWALWARDLGCTCDPNVIKYLAPYLDCKVELYDFKLCGLVPGERLPALRACDVAMEAILRILDEDREEAYKEAGYEYGKVMKNFHNDYKKVCDDMNKIRDRMIEELKKRLNKE